VKTGEKFCKTETACSEPSLNSDRHPCVQDSVVSCLTLYTAWAILMYGALDEIVISNLACKGGTISELRGWDHLSLALKGLVCLKPVMPYGYFTLIQLEQGAWDFSTSLRPTKMSVEKCEIILGLQSDVPANRFLVFPCVNPDWRSPRNQASSSSTFLSNQQT